jgi:formate-dependent phosphoribosylglycinamide formyltransferase (GAR transformylase)
MAGSDARREEPGQAMDAGTGARRRAPSKKLSAPQRRRHEAVAGSLRRRRLLAADGRVASSRVRAYRAGMVHVVFAIPFAMENTLRFAQATAALAGVRMSVVTQDPADKFPAEFRAQLAGLERVADAMQPDDLAAAVRTLAGRLGPAERLLGILEPLQEPLAVVRERLRIRGMDAATAANFRDKARMKSLFAAHDLPCARHQLCATLDDALAFARQVGFPLVGKPPAGAGAKATSRCDTIEELTAFVKQAAPARGREVLLEEFVLGREFSFDTVTLHGRHVFHNVCCYYPTPLEVMANPWIQWCVVLPRDLDGPQFAAIHRIGPRALSTLGMWTGMSHMEWFHRADGSIAIGEVAARPPGAQFTTLMSWVTGTDMYRAFAELMVFETFTPPPRRYAAGAAYLRGQLDGKRDAKDAVVRAVHGLDRVQRELGDLIVETREPVVGRAASASYEGDGFVLVRHPDTAVVTKAVQHVVATVRVELG